MINVQSRLTHKSKHIHAKIYIINLTLVTNNNDQRESRLRYISKGLYFVFGDAFALLFVL